MGYTVVLDLEGAPELPNKIGKRHWTVIAKHRRAWRTWVVLAARGKQPPRPLQRASVKLEIWRKRRTNPDNLVASVKPLIDGLQPGGVYTRGNRRYPTIGCGIIADDYAENFEGGRPEVIFHQCAKGEKPHVRITVEESTGGDDE